MFSSLQGQLASQHSRILPAAVTHDEQRWRIDFVRNFSSMGDQLFLLACANQRKRVRHFGVFDKQPLSARAAAVSGRGSLSADMNIFFLLVGV
jgi:hypothetical protein